MTIKARLSKNTSRLCRHSGCRQRKYKAADLNDAMAITLLSERFGNAKISRGRNMVYDRASRGLDRLFGHQYGYDSNAEGNNS